MTPLPQWALRQLIAAAGQCALGPLSPDPLKLIDMSIRSQPHYVFDNRGAWDAFNVNTAQMTAGLDTAGVYQEAGYEFSALMVDAVPSGDPIEPYYEVAAAPAPASSALISRSMRCTRKVT